jgi:NAD(P)-dependent dehydrogenase (short-subunit alcohol dehydrogenase family)
LGRVGAPTDIAAVCLFLSSDAAAFVTGETLVVAGGPHTSTPADIELIRVPATTTT